MPWVINLWWITATAGEGANLAGEVRVVNGGIAPETGTLTGNFTILQENGSTDPTNITGCDTTIMEESEFTYETPTGMFLIGETITGNTSGAIAQVVGVELDTKTIIYNLTSGSFTLGETVYGMNQGRTWCSISCYGIHCSLTHKYSSHQCR